MKQTLMMAFAITIALLAVQEFNKFMADPEFYGVSAEAKERRETDREVYRAIEGLTYNNAERKETCAEYKRQGIHEPLCD